MSSPHNGFKSLSDHLLKIENFFDPGPVKTITFNWEDKDFLKKLRTTIANGGENLPKTHPYERDYIKPLLSDDLETIIWKLADQVHADSVRRPTDPGLYAILTLLANAAIQPGQADVAADVQCLQSFVTEMYESFLAARKKTGIEEPLDHKYPPLVGYIGRLPGRVNFDPPLRIPMPCALEVEQLRDSYLLGPVVGKGFKVGVIGLSAGYRKHPLMWGVLAHELGGHYSLTADKRDTMLAEIQDKIYEMLEKREYKEPECKVAAHLWRFWAEEAASEVCGVLNLGPQYGIGSMAFFTAIIRLAGYRTTSQLSQQYTNNPWDLHPIPALIPHLINGAINGSKLDEKRKQASIELIRNIAKDYGLIDDVVVFPEYSQVWDPRDTKKDPIDLPLALPLKEMQEIAQDVGEFIATVKLHHLNNSSLRDLEMAWNDRDEDNALIARNEFMKNNSWDFTINGNKAKNRHLLSGGILAVMQNHERYDKVSRTLSEAFRSNA